MRSRFVKTMRRYERLYKGYVSTGGLSINSPQSKSELVVGHTSHRPISAKVRDVIDFSSASDQLLTMLTMHSSNIYALIPCGEH